MTVSSPMPAKLVENFTYSIASPYQSGFIVYNDKASVNDKFDVNSTNVQLNNRDPNLPLPSVLPKIEYKQMEIVKGVQLPQNYSRPELSSQGWILENGNKLESKDKFKELDRCANNLEAEKQQVENPFIKLGERIKELEHQNKSLEEKMNSREKDNENLRLAFDSLKTNDQEQYNILRIKNQDLIQEKLDIDKNLTQKITELEKENDSLNTKIQNLIGNQKDFDVGLQKEASAYEEKIKELQKQDFTYQEKFMELNSNYKKQFELQKTTYQKNLKKFEAENQKLKELNDGEIQENQKILESQQIYYEQKLEDIDTENSNLMLERDNLREKVLELQGIIANRQQNNNKNQQK